VNLIPRCTGADVVVYALPGAYDAEFSALDLEIQELTTRLTLVPES
jgi:hypothetical protein